jgi:hypothetical protein
MISQAEALGVFDRQDDAPESLALDSRSSELSSVPTVVVEVGRSAVIYTGVVSDPETEGIRRLMAEARANDIERGLIAA